MNKLFLKSTTLFVLLIILSGYLLFFHLGKGSLWDWDEAIYATVAKTMAQDGDFTSLHMNGNYWPEKPPLIIWCIALAHKTFGLNEFSTRLPIAIFGLLNVLLIYFVGRRFFNHWIGLISGLFLLTNLHFLISSRTAMLDVPMMFFASSTLCLFWLCREKPIGLIIAGIAMGLAVMTKGPIGFFPLLIIILYILLLSQYSLLKQPSFWAMIIISLMISVPWHVWQILVHGEAFTHYYFIYNLFMRVTSVIEGHTGTVFYYIKYVFEHFFTPWLCLSFVVLLGFGPKLVRRFQENKSAPIYFLLIWFFTLFLVFSLAKTKVVGYIIPCYFPLALITVKLSLDNLQYRWFKILFFSVLVVTTIEITLFHPLHWLTIDKSQEVKQISATVKSDDTHVLISYNIPPNAPSFYFASKVIYMEDWTQLAQMLSWSKDLYILCKNKDFQALQVHLEGKYHLRVLASSQNGNVQLVSVN